MQIGRTHGISPAATSAFTMLDWVAWGLLLVGALNWGSVGLFGVDLVAALFGPMTATSRVIYVLVGVAGVYFLTYPFRRRL